MKILSMVLLCLLMAFSSLNGWAGTSNGLIANWSFDDCTANDSSGNGNNGVINGTVSCELGKKGQAMIFNGVNNFIKVPNSASLNPDKQITISLWMRPDDLSGNWYTILHKGGAGTDCLKNREYAVFLYGTNRSLYQMAAGDNACQEFSFKDNVVSTGQWVHYVGIVDLTNHIMKIYINGQLSAQQPINRNSFTQNAASLLIGYTEENFGYFKGALDEIQLYNRALSDAEITNLYQLSYTNVASGLNKCCWNRAIQSCNSNSDCDGGGEGCRVSGTPTQAYGAFACSTCESQGQIYDRTTGSCKAPTATQPDTSNDIPEGYNECATEGGTYNASQATDIAYGANGIYRYKASTKGIIIFNPTTFGGIDPVPGVVKKGYCRVSATANPIEGYTKCADEGGQCNFTQLTDVAYGANGKFIFRNGVTGNFTFTPSTFGGIDPAPGVVKQGYWKPSSSSSAIVLNPKSDQLVPPFDTQAKLNEVYKVEYIKGKGEPGRFVNTDGRNWKEINSDGLHICTEYGRFPQAINGLFRAGTIILNCSGNNVELNLVTYKVNLLNVNFQPAGELYTINYVRKRPLIDDTANNINEAYRVEYYNNFGRPGIFVNTGGTGWTEINSEVNKNLYEVARNDQAQTITISDGTNIVELNLGTYKVNLLDRANWPNPNYPNSALYSIDYVRKASLPGEAPPGGYIRCTSDGGACKFDQRVDVAYGANGNFVYKSGVIGEINFTPAAFAYDPLPGEAKQGYYKLSPKSVANTANSGEPNPNDVDVVVEWMTQQAAGDDKEYCYKRSYGRGAGTPLSDCPAGSEKNGLLCYPKCPEGSRGAGPMCWPDCPKGFRDDGLFCAKTGTYTPGGYAWKFGDGLNLDSATDRCNADHPQLGCEKLGEMIYAKCDPGMRKVGLTCWQDCPPSMPDNGTSCMKRTTMERGTGSSMTCKEGYENNSGLCYPVSKPGYYGVGPVSWQSCSGLPQSFECGVGCAKTQSDCAEKTSDMVLAPIMMAANILTLGSTSEVTAAKSAMTTALKARKFADAAKDFTSMVKALAKGFEKMTKKVVVDKLKEKFPEAVRDVVIQTYIRKSAHIAMGKKFSPDDLRALTGLDPTGVAGVIDAYTQPVCGESDIPFPTLSKSY